MPSGDWDTRYYPPSRPLPATGGIATSKQRGAMASTWWSNRLVTLLESYGLGGRMERGRRYARRGQILALEVEPGRVSAQVQGSRPAPYDVIVSMPPLTTAQWAAVERAMQARVAFVAQLLAGEVPPELEEVFADGGVPLFPHSWYDLRARCSCPDWGDPCKHVAAVLYVLADRLDDDPWLLLQWRGRGRDELLARLRPAPAERAQVAGLPPWWPLVPGVAVPEVAERTAGGTADTLLAEPPAEPATVLQRCEPLDVHVGGRPVTELLGPAYEAFVQ